MIAASLLGAYGAVATFTQTKDLTSGEIRLSVSPGHRGALDVYVPLVDWGARFEAIRLPARLRVDLRTVDRAAVTKVAQGDALDVHDVRNEARDAIAAYLRSLIAVACSPRPRARPARRVRDPQPHRPAAARARARSRSAPRSRAGSRSSRSSRRGARSTIRSTTPTAPTSRARSRRSTSPSAPSRALDEELDAQLVGLARLVVAIRRSARRSPARRASRSPPTCTTTSSRCRSSSAPPAAARSSSRAT